MQRLSSIGARVDRITSQMPPQTVAAPRHLCAALPRVLVNARGMAVVFKPPGWEVDGPHSEPGSQSFLSDFVRQEFPLHYLPTLPEFQYGFVHRLDVPSSGLILVGNTFEGLYSLRLQINTFSISREYAVLCHGTTPASFTECNIPIDLVARRSLTGSQESSDRGSVALTWFKFMMHGRVEWRQLSLASIRIHTGRGGRLL